MEHCRGGSALLSPSPQAMDWLLLHLMRGLGVWRCRPRDLIHVPFHHMEGLYAPSPLCCSVWTAVSPGGVLRTVAVISTLARAVSIGRMGRHLISSFHSCWESLSSFKYDNATRLLNFFLLSPYN